MAGWRALGNLIYLCGMQAEIGTDLARAAQWLRQGECVGIPTETVYGLGANALDRDAVARIFRAKDRPDFDPLIVHIGRLEDLDTFAREVPDTARQLAAAFWPGPLTLILPRRTLIPYEVTSGLDTVGLRMPRHPLTLELLSSLEFPLAAPSANPFGYVSPTTAQHVADQLGSRIPYILDGGACAVGIESTIVGFEDKQPVIYRQGIITREMVETVAGPTRLQVSASSNPKAPGMLLSHYAPHTPVFILQEEMDFHPQRTGFIGFRQPHGSIPVTQQYLLAEDGDMYTAARSFYAALRHLDGLRLEKILIELLPDEGIGAAINDRIRRAATLPH